MFIPIPSHGNPEGNAYGISGATFSSDTGIFYIKDGHNTLNIGWRVAGVPGPTPTPTATPTPTPTETPTGTPVPSPTETPTETPTGTPANTPTPTPTETPTPTTSPTETPTPTPTVVTYHLTINTGQLGMFNFQPIIADYPYAAPVTVSVDLFPDWYFDIWSDIDPVLLTKSKYVNPNDFAMPSQSISITPVAVFLIISGSEGQSSSASPFTMSAIVTSSVETGSFSIEMRYTASAANTASWYDTGSWFLVPPPTGGWSTVTASLLERPQQPIAFRITGSMTTVFTPSSGSGYYQFRVGIFDDKTNLDDIGNYLTSSIVNLV